MSHEEAPRGTKRPQEDPTVAGKCPKRARNGAQNVPKWFRNGPQKVPRGVESLFERKSRKTLKMTTLQMKMLDFEGSK